MTINMQKGPLGKTFENFFFLIFLKYQHKVMKNNNKGEINALVIVVEKL